MFFHETHTIAYGGFYHTENVLLEILTTVCGGFYHVFFPETLNHHTQDIDGELYAFLLFMGNYFVHVNYEKYFVKCNLHI